MGDGTQRRCIEVHPKQGLRCEARYQHQGAHYYAHMGAMPEPIEWLNTVDIPFWRCQSTHVMWGSPQRCWKLRWHFGPHQVCGPIEFAPMWESNDGSLP